MPDSWKRPKLKIAKTKSEWFWDIVGYSFYLISLIFLLYHWMELPDKVPVHYNALGEVDRWGAKTELFIVPGIGVILAVFLQLIEKFPESHNYPERLNEQNAREFYLVSRHIINQIKGICLIVLALILFETVSLALGREIGLGKWFLPIVLCTLIPIILGIIKQKRIK